VTTGIIEQARTEGRTLLSEVESKQLLEEAGVPVAKSRLAASADEAAAAARETGFPVVMKIVSPDIAHKSDVGGVRLDLGDEGAVRAAYDEMMKTVKGHEPNARISGVAVQNQAAQGTEVIVGMTRDPQFGPVMMFGLGGIMVEVLKDVAFRIVPLEARDAAEMVREIKGYPVLQGVRGQPPLDEAALQQIILKVAAFVEQHPEVSELDLNPVFVYAQGAVAVDARVVLSKQ
jgi:acyl-CoA synthetase (NDP forming)